MRIMRSMSMVLCLRQEVSTNRFIRCCHLGTLGPCHLVIIMRIQRAWRSTRRMRDMSSMIVWEARGLELFQVHKDNQGNEADSQALTAALHVIVFVWMLLCALMLITSSVRGHSRPFSPALTAALHVIVFICCIFTHHFSRRSMRLFRKHWQQHCKWLYLSGFCSVPWRSSHQAYAVTLDLSRKLSQRHEYTRLYDYTWLYDHTSPVNIHCHIWLYMAICLYMALALYMVIWLYMAIWLNMVIWVYMAISQYMAIWL